MELDKKLEDYIFSVSDKEHDVLADLNRNTHLKILHPRMLSGHLQGMMLRFITRLLKPQKVLEIGTYTGYSAICFALELGDSGMVHTIEINDELKNFSQEYFHKAGMALKIKQHTGNALEIIPSLNDSFDLVFIDGEKEEYVDYYELSLEKLNSGGIIIADNVLWSGKVVEEPDPKDKSTEGILAFNAHVRDDDRVNKFILPIRDGLFLIQKK